MQRLEDLALLSGKGQYTEDLNKAEQLVMKVLRSTHAHANITALNIQSALQMKGVHCVLTATDKDVVAIKPMNCRATLDDAGFAEPDRPVLATTQVKYVGEPIAAVVAETDALAQDALECIEISYESLPVETQVEAAATSEILLWNDIHGNKAFSWEKGNGAETQQLFDEAEHTISLRVEHPRMAITPIEPRSYLAEYHPDNKTYTLNTPSQGVMSLQRALCGFMGIEKHRLRVVTRDVGGSFAMKIWPYAEQILALIAAKRTKQPVKWTATRSESLQSDIAGRGRVDHAELAFDNDGTFKAFRISALADMGAYLNAVAPFIATYGAVRPFGQAYRFPGLHYRVEGIYTNTVPTDAYRGAGKPESACTLERIIDVAADTLNMDRLAIRKLNLVRPVDLPYDTPMNETYDAGNYPALAEHISTAANWNELQARKQTSKANGKLRGAGLAFYLHATGGSTDERSEVCAMPNGDIRVRTGIQDNGQGHKTTLAMVVAEALEVNPERVRVEQGDTAWLSQGGGTGGSNLMSVVATTVHRASITMLNTMRPLAASHLNTEDEKLEYIKGQFTDTGTGNSIDLAEIALRSIGSNQSPESEHLDAPACTGVAEFEGTHTTFPTGACIVEVEIDPQTGAVQIDSYTGIDDLGKVYNIESATGQIHGGFAQAAGEVLMEKLVYDDHGQLISGSLMDYQIPRAKDLPTFHTLLTETDSPNSILGAKGVGELTSIGTPGAIHNAVMDALSEFGITHLDKPLTPIKIWNAIRATTTSQTDHI